MRTICPPACKQDKLTRGSGTGRTQGALFMRYCSSMHMAIANMRRLDGAYPPSRPEGGVPALDVFAPKDKPMCVSFERNWCFPCVNSISIFCRRFYIRTAGENKTPLYGYWFFNMLYNTAVRKRLEGWLGCLPETTDSVDRFLDETIKV